MARSRLPARPRTVSCYHFALGHRKEADALVKKYHYSHRPSPGASIIGSWHESGGLFGDSGPMVAACFFKPPSNAAWGPLEPILELTRLVRTPDCDAQLTELIAETIVWVKRQNFDLLISYADPGPGHHGGVYQAASWKFDRRRDPYRDGFIIAGKFVPNRSCADRYKTTSIDRLRALGLDPVKHIDQGKYMYWRALNKNGRRLAERYNFGDLPYPKPGPAIKVEGQPDPIITKQRETK